MRKCVFALKAVAVDTNLYSISTLSFDIIFNDFWFFLQNFCHENDAEIDSINAAVSIQAMAIKKMNSIVVPAIIMVSEVGGSRIKCQQRKEK